MRLIMILKRRLIVERRKEFNQIDFGDHDIICKVTPALNISVLDQNTCSLSANILYFIIVKQ